jgi:heme/copper-type cytochrome/quinol oxidase subunit 2
MREIGTTQAEGCRVRLWRWTLTVLVLLSLVVALATRFQVTVQDTVTVQSIASRAMRQHMNQDAVRWVVPILQLTVLQAPTFHPHMVPADSSLPSLSVEENLYNRPPPAC